MCTGIQVFVDLEWVTWKIKFISVVQHCSLVFSYDQLFETRLEESKEMLEFTDNNNADQNCLNVILNYGSKYCGFNIKKTSSFLFQH